MLLHEKSFWFNNWKMFFLKNRLMTNVSFQFSKVNKRSNILLWSKIEIRGSVDGGIWRAGYTKKRRKWRQKRILYIYCQNFSEIINILMPLNYHHNCKGLVNVLLSINSNLLVWPSNEISFVLVNLVKLE